MQSNFTCDPIQEIFIFETSQQLQQLEGAIINIETSEENTAEYINEIFRIMHTIKSSAAMMMFNNISKVAHSTEDLFYYIRESKPKNVDKSGMCDIVLEGVDFMKVELEKIKNGENADGEEKSLLEKISEYLKVLKEDNNDSTIVSEREITSKKQFYISSNKEPKHLGNNMFKATIFFQKECQMENIRAFGITHNLKDISEEIYHFPEDIIENNENCEIIKNDGFIIFIKTDKSYKDIETFFSQTAFLERVDLIQLESEDDYNESKVDKTQNDSIKIPEINEGGNEKEKQNVTSNQSAKIISVNVQKLDKLMDLVGEMVIAESMVTQNPDLKGLNLQNFDKAARQLRKIASELQDTVMSIRMVPLGPTFFKMNRIVRDMSKKLGKVVHLEILGEETEVDKNIIEHIGDPLMHLVRNSVDHGIETPQERAMSGKTSEGSIVLEAKNVGSEVLIIIRDNGKGINKDNIIKKASDNGILPKSPSEMTDKEIYNLIFLPGFSTKEAVSEFSGRGVGMDVVAKNIEAVGGSIQVDSTEGKGTTITLKIPLTLAIIDGMNIKVGKSRYTIPTTSIKESFRPKETDIFKDTEGNEMIMIRGSCYKILRLHQHFNVKTNITKVSEGILIMAENDKKEACIFADALIGEQQVVVKALPQYINNIKKINGLSGCTLLGDGSISLILDVNALID